jgi:hypothetical protein
LAIGGVENLDIASLRTGGEKMAIGMEGTRREGYNSQQLAWS